MRISGFTFLRNGIRLGYPFGESIRSILPIVDEFVIALGPSDDGTEEKLKAIGDPRVRIIYTQWNENIRNDLKVKGFVYGQQKSIALFNCTGDWAFYLEGDEVVHEDDLPRIRESMERHLNNTEVEALYFDYLHFYGNRNTYAWSPGWYRKAPRILRNNIVAWAPKGLFFAVLDDKFRGRYPKAASANGRIFHYGTVRSQEQWDAKTQAVHKYWSNRHKKFDYDAVDPKILRPFTGTHPAVIQGWLPPAEGVFKPRPGHRLTLANRRHRLMLKLEALFHCDMTHKHYKRVG